MLPYASWIEILQVVLATLGVGITFWRMWVALQDGLSIISLSADDLRRLVAETQVIGEVFRLFTQCCLVSIGIVSTLLPPPTVEYGEGMPQEYLQAFLTRTGLIVITIVLVADSFVQEFRRRQFLAVVKDRNGVLPPEWEALSHEQGSKLAATIITAVDRQTAVINERFDRLTSSGKEA